MAKGHIAEKNGVYYCVIAFRDPLTKKDRRKWIRSGNSKREAEKLLVKLLYEMDTSGGYIEPPKMTVGEYLEYWLEKYARKNTRKNTFEVKAE